MGNIIRYRRCGIQNFLYTLFRSMDIGQQCLHILTDIPKLLSGLIDKSTLTADSFHGALNAFIGLLRILDQILDEFLRLPLQNDLQAF